MNRRSSSVLILAASRYQIPFIQRAKQMGYRVITVDNVPENPGHALGDRFVHVSTTDQEAVLEVAREDKVAGILAPCTDVAVPTAAFVSERLGLPGIPVRAASIVCRKTRFREFQQANGFRTPNWRMVTDEPLSLDSLGGCVVVKPDMASGAKGTRMVTEHDDVDAAISEAAQVSLNGVVLVETFLQGCQVTCEGFWSEESMVFSMITDRLTAAPPFVTTQGHDTPSRLGVRIEEAIVGEIVAVLRALDVKQTLFDADVVIHDDEVYLLEIALRVGGNSIADLVRVSGGIDLCEAAITLACEGVWRPKTASISWRPSCLRILGSPQAGILDYNSTKMAEVGTWTGVEKVELDVLPKTYVEAFMNSRHRVGEVITTGATREEAESRMERVIKHLSLRVEA